jgi:hypothetical protein
MFCCFKKEREIPFQMDDVTKPQFTCMTCTEIFDSNKKMWVNITKRNGKGISVDLWEPCCMSCLVEQVNHEKRSFESQFNGRMKWPNESPVATCTKCMRENIPAYQHHKKLCWKCGKKVSGK